MRQPEPELPLVHNKLLDEEIKNLKKNIKIAKIRQYPQDKLARLNPLEKLGAL